MIGEFYVRLKLLEGAFKITGERRVGEVIGSPLADRSGDLLLGRIVRKIGEVEAIRRVVYLATFPQYAFGAGSL